eukprot:SM000033S12396  [mRNA]  locus=s33:782387:785290:+ [translate_table: standard]
MHAYGSSKRQTSSVVVASAAASPVMLSAAPDGVPAEVRGDSVLQQQVLPPPPSQPDRAGGGDGGSMRHGGARPPDEGVKEDLKASGKPLRASRSARRKQAKRRWGREERERARTGTDDDDEEEEEEEEGEGGKEVGASEASMTVLEGSAAQQACAEADDREEVGGAAEEEEAEEGVEEQDGEDEDGEEEREAEAVEEEGRGVAQRAATATTVVATVVAVSDDQAPPVIVRKGHVRFEPPDEGAGAPSPPLPILNLAGPMGKKRGQAWGQHHSSSPQARAAPKRRREVARQATSPPKLPQMHTANDDSVDYSALPLLNRHPRQGDILAYRLVELSSSWTPELSTYREGQVVSFDEGSNAVQLAGTQRTLFALAMAQKDQRSREIGGESSEHQGHDKSGPTYPAPYGECGDLSIDLTGLVDARILHASSGQRDASLQRRGSQQSASSLVQATAEQGLERARLEEEVQVQAAQPVEVTEVGAVTSERLAIPVKVMEGCAAAEMGPDHRRSPEVGPENGRKAKAQSEQLTGPEPSGVPTRTATPQPPDGRPSLWKQWEEVARELQQRRLELAEKALHQRPPSSPAEPSGNPALSPMPKAASTPSNVGKERGPVGPPSSSRSGGRRAPRSSAVGPLLQLLRAESGL